MSIYAVVKIHKPFLDAFDFHIYSKQTSNLEVINAYKAEQELRHPNDDVLIMTRETAYALRKIIIQKMKEREKKNLEKLEKPDERKEVIARWRRSKDTMPTFISTCGCGSMRGAFEAYAEARRCEEW